LRTGTFVIILVFVGSMDVALNERTTAYESVHLFHYIWNNRSGSLKNKQECDFCRIANSSCEIYECYKIGEQICLLVLLHSSDAFMCMF